MKLVSKNATAVAMQADVSLYLNRHDGKGKEVLTHDNELGRHKEPEEVENDLEDGPFTTFHEAP